MKDNQINFPIKLQIEGLNRSVESLLQFRKENPLDKNKLEDKEVDVVINALSLSTCYLGMSGVNGYATLENTKAAKTTLENALNHLQIKNYRDVVVARIKGIDDYAKENPGPHITVKEDRLRFNPVDFLYRALSRRRTNL